ncbi:ATPase [Nautilia profundicola AmH]|uniref:DNA repair protein RecN n=1 Tax=Nautilia profundicola (strain ATCC BAA-1463 / DSM 18972 / AmH) TaxID=598659 RepID=B9L9Y1_NAUPA|nr:AAA family ATPase [Nautilia profundicola]ACM93458.1 ATPase [Nautilia profundicola AmH]
MIERVYLKEYVTFDEVELEFSEVELEFSKGLIVFTGPSGAGKSVLMRGILSIFGYFDLNAKLGEAIVDADIDLEKFGLEKDDILIFKQMKKNKNRFFINNQAVSRKIIREIADKFLNYLSLREIKEFENENILLLLDKMNDNKKHHQNLKTYNEKYNLFKSIQKELHTVLFLEKEAAEKKEFLKYELEKIEKIDPKHGEFEELMEIKKDLSKIEKIKEKVFEVERIFDFEYSVYELLEMSGLESEFFSNAMNELRIAIDKANEKADYLENVDIEEVLERLSNLQDLIRRYGSVEEALEYYEEKKKELEKLENLSFEKEDLEKKLELISKDLYSLADIISDERKKTAKKLNEKLNYYLEKLYMPKAEIVFNKTELNRLGIDNVEIIINEIDINTISTGEFNRLRVAMLASKLEYENQEMTLFLDEIDANLSGEESMSVAEVLKYLSSKYQIFAISHQPQLASKANKHFLVEKKDGKSMVRELNKNERIEEIARIIGGKEKSQKAIEYAKELLKENND